MFDFEIAFYLYKMAKIQKIFLDSQYKAKAYYNAALAIDAYSSYVEEMYRQNSLQKIPFVGTKIEKCIIEILETGEFRELKEYEKEYGIKDYSLILSAGLSENLIKKLLGVSIKSAYELIDDECIDNLKKVLTSKELEKVFLFRKDFQKNQGKYLLSYGKCLGEALICDLKKISGMENPLLSGEIFEYCEKISVIEILFNYHGKWNTLVSQIKKINGILDIQFKECEEISGKTKFGIPFKLKYCTDKLVIEEDDISLKKHIKGDLHTHTLWTDGLHSIEEMGEAAKKLNYEYLAVTDHSASMRIAHGLSESQALSQIQKITEYNNSKNEVKLLAGIEVDILPDGSLDYCDEVLEQFDFVIAAIHSHLEQNSLDLYNRLEKALSNPYVNILAHPTARLLGRPGVLFSERKPYDIDLQSIISLCKRYDVTLEVNCFPERLDLGKEGILFATKQGVKISLGTDSHSKAHLCNIDYGIGIINSSFIDKEMILNTYSYTELIEYFKRKRPKNINVKEKIFPKREKNFQYYFENNIDIIEGKKSVIGIDLTGSEDKESGWAYLKSDFAVCKRIKSNSEIIESIRRLNPDVVSIDSPLAFPQGRCCSRKDCECRKYGIMRKSERSLRHFGINVYPCLIDSMINLTTRGMSLAKQIRNMGYKVIESYPGVAQDILQIPRKGKTVEQFQHLKQGLASFGIVGDLLDNPNISHDEVDAITSALVGYFYLNEQYVGLGNKEEDYLIVPRIQEELMDTQMIIGLCGETGAGKTTIADYLQFKYGLKKFRYSKVIQQKYGVTKKEELQKIGAEIAKDSYTQRELTRYMIEHMEPGKSYVVDGLRHMEDYEELKKEFGDKFIFVYVDCRYINRYKRYNKLNFNDISMEKFEIISNHESEKDIILLGLNSYYRIDNNKGFKDLCYQVDRIIEEESGGKI